MQMGAPGSVTIGSFTLPLFPPRSNEYLNYGGMYSKIKYGQRIEGYVLGESGEFMLGIPVFSGIITKIIKTLHQFEISGFDTLWLANQQSFYPGQSYSGDAVSIIDIFNDIEQLLFLDDFSGNRYPSYATAWTPAIGTAWTSTVDDGLNTLSHSGSAEAVILANPALVGSRTSVGAIVSGTAGLGDSVVASAWFHISSIPVTNGIFVGAELILGSDAAAANHFMARAACYGNGTTYDVKAEIWTKVAGTYTLQKSTTVFTGLTGDRRFQVFAIFAGATSSLVLLVNGKDSGCSVNLSFATFEGGNYFGVRWGPSPGTAATVNFTQYYIKMRSQSGFGFGAYPQPLLPFTDAGGPLGAIPQITVTALSLNGLNLLDLWSLSTTALQWVWRKDAGRMLVRPLYTDAGETISWGLQGKDVGRDLSASITLDEEVNIVSGGAVANAEHIGTEVVLGFSTNTDGNGRINWPDGFGILNMGQGPDNLAPPLVLPDIINITGLSDMLLARRIVESVGAQKSLRTGQAKTFTIMRTPELATPSYEALRNQLDFSGLPGDPSFFQALAPQAFRELDFVKLNCPSLGIFNAKVAVVSYTFRESDPTFDVTLDQFASDSKHLVDRRRWGSIDTAFLNFAVRS
jgi:hypothetical protein